VICLEIPEWVCWVAQDADGAWWGYQAEPNQSHQGWYENEVGDSVQLGNETPNHNWAVTLKRIK
jgi:hypothetical protein